MSSKTIAAIIEKCRGMIDTVGLPALRDDIIRSISLRKVRGLPDRITTLSEELRLSTSNESHFLNIGRTLQSVYTDTTELIRHIQDTIREIMGDEDDNILNKAGNLAKQAETALTLHQERVASSLIEIKDVADHLGGLNQACDYLGRIAMNLRVVGLNIGVESTRSVEGQEMFTVVSKEILQLSEKVVAIVNRIREDATEAMTEQMQAFNTISGGLQELNGLTVKASGVTSAAANETEKGIAAFLKAFETADSRFREISNRVGEIVMNIQFHDNMRQRVEHITDALDKSARTLGGRSSDRGHTDLKEAEHAPGQGDSRKEAFGHACSVVALQKSQLADVITEINRVHRESTAGFEEIGREIGELDGIMSNVNADINEPGIRNTETLSDPFSKLATALTGLNELLGRGDELGSRIDESVSRASDIGRRFSVHLSDVNAISFETKIKALNAIVKAGHMSEEGRTLDVLAQEMNRLSDQSNDFVAGVEDKLRRIGEFGDRIQNLGKDIQEGDEQHPSEVSGVITGGIEEISRMRDLMNTRVGEAMEKVEALRMVVRQTLSNLDFLTLLADEMSGHLETLDAVDGRLSPLAEKWKTGESSGADMLSESYTMQRERMIHATVFSRNDKLLEETKANDNKPGSIEMDGDISLWGDDETADGEAHQGEGDISLWGDDETADGEALPGEGDVSLWGDDETADGEAHQGEGDVSLWGDDETADGEALQGDGDISLWGDDETADGEALQGEGDVSLWGDDKTADGEALQGDDEIETKMTSPKKGEDDEALGDNIELF
jgi:methyl-accepting chemotaxis protein